MSSSHQSLSAQQFSDKADLSSVSFGIVTSEWNSEITESLFEGAYSTLLRSGIRKDQISRISVPGSYELSLGAQWMAERTDVVICLGSVVQGETPHFDYICQAVARGITDVNLKYNKPVIFGVLTTLNFQQAMDRAGGQYGNKGDEAAVTALKMISLQLHLGKGKED